MSKQTPDYEQIRDEVFEALWNRRPPATIPEVKDEIEKKYGIRLSNTFLYSVKAKIEAEHQYAKGSIQVYSVEERENARALHAFRDFQKATDAKNTAEVITKLEPVMPIAEKVDQVLKRGKSERVKKAIQEFINKKLEEIDSDLGAIIENFEKDAGKAFGVEDEEEETTE